MFGNYISSLLRQNIVNQSLCFTEFSNLMQSLDESLCVKWPSSRLKSASPGTSNLSILHWTACTKRATKASRLTFCILRNLQSSSALMWEPCTLYQHWCENLVPHISTDLKTLYLTSALMWEPCTSHSQNILHNGTYNFLLHSVKMSILRNVSYIRYRY
jgi:hypothetical protein